MGPDHSPCIHTVQCYKIKDVDSVNQCNFVNITSHECIHCLSHDFVSFECHRKLQKILTKNITRFCNGKLWCDVDTCTHQTWQQSQKLRWRWAEVLLHIRKQWREQRNEGVPQLLWSEPSEFFSRSLQKVQYLVSSVDLKMSKRYRMLYQVWIWKWFWKISCHSDTG